MKSGLSCMVIAAEEFVKKYPDHKGTLAFLVTSDEEGPALHGTRKVVEYLLEKEWPLTYALVGEASSNQQLGDAIKIGRRGSMHGKLTIFGKQGHIAYPDLAENPIHRCFLPLQALAQESWDTGNKFFTPTSFQCYDIFSGSGAKNVIPGELQVHFNFRFSPLSSPERLQERCKEILDQHPLRYELEWNVSSNPFFSGYGTLATVCQEAIQTICQIQTEPNTYGGTSDGRFLAAVGCEVVELGPVNVTAHHVNENVSIADLQQLTKIYYNVLEQLLWQH